MKLILVSFFLALLAACAQPEAPPKNWRDQGYDQQAERIADMLRAGKIKTLEANKQMVLVAKNYFPNDQLLIQLWEDLVVLAERAGRDEIDAEKYTELFNFRWAMFEDANRNRHAEAAAIVAQKQNAAFMGRLLGNIGQSMQRNNPQPITCRSTSMPGVVTTNCQ